MAKELVDKIDQHQNTDSRFYLVVAPGSREGTENLGFHEQDANYWGTLQRVGLSIFEQARRNGARIYPIGFPVATHYMKPSDWQHQFGEFCEQFARCKRAHDPLSILTPGPRVSSEDLD